MKAIQFVENRYIERRCCCSLFDEASHMEVWVVGPVINEPMNEIRIAVICEDDRTVGCENLIKIFIRNAVRMMLR